MCTSLFNLLYIGCTNWPASKISATQFLPQIKVHKTHAAIPSPIHQSDNSIPSVILGSFGFTRPSVRSARQLVNSLHRVDRILCCKLPVTPGAARRCAHRRPEVPEGRLVQRPPRDLEFREREREEKSLLEEVVKTAVENVRRRGYRYSCLTV